MNSPPEIRFAAGVRRLRAAGVPDPVNELRRIVQWGNRPGAKPTDIECAIARRARREPFSHIAGQRSFWKFDFDVTPAVLDPRPESEAVVEAVLSTVPRMGMYLVRRILDLGTGSGCLLLSILGEFPAAGGVGIDFSQDALLVARRNALRCGLGARCAWAAGDWAAAIGEPFDIVISNPPYIESDVIPSLEPEVRDSEPQLALDGGTDGLDAYRRLIPQLRHCLAPHGFVCLECDPRQVERVVTMLLSAGLREPRRYTALDGQSRCVLAWGASPIR